MPAKTRKRFPGYRLPNSLAGCYSGHLVIQLILAMDGYRSGFGCDEKPYRQGGGNRLGDVGRFSRTMANAINSILYFIVLRYLGLANGLNCVPGVVGTWGPYESLYFDLRSKDSLVKAK